jgi:hypothetical protein
MKSREERDREARALSVYHRQGTSRSVFVQGRERFQNDQPSEARARHRASVSDLDHVQGSRHSEVLRTVRDVDSLYHVGRKVLL